MHSQAEARGASAEPVGGQKYAQILPLGGAELSDISSSAPFIDLCPCGAISVVSASNFKAVGRRMISQSCHFFLCSCLILCFEFSGEFLPA